MVTRRDASWTASASTAKTQTVSTSSSSRVATTAGDRHFGDLFSRQGIGKESRTPDTEIISLVLYQLSYSSGGRRHHVDTLPPSSSTGTRATDVQRQGRSTGGRAVRVMIPVSSS
jgi:hypothetical protein